MLKQQILRVTMSVLVVSSLSANTNLQNDLDFAFGGEVQANSVTVLDDTQMNEIQGKGLKKAFKKISKAVNWVDNRYTILKYTALGVAYVNGLPMSYNSATGSTTITLW